MHSRAASIALPGATPPFDVLRQFFALDLGLSVLAAAGLLSLVLLVRWWDATFLGLWVIGSLAMLAAFRPLFPHHPVILTSGLAVAAGVGAAVCVRSLQTVQPSLLLPAVLGALVYVTLLPRLLHDDRHVLYAGENPRIPPLVAFVERRTAANAMVATDDLAVADEAQRLVPPPLCDPSNVRLRSGYLSAATLIDATRRYHATVVLPTFGIYQQVPQYMDWVRRHYRAETARSGETAYIRK
jgi:hypothetical protein